MKAALLAFALFLSPSLASAQPAADLAVSLQAPDVVQEGTFAWTMTARNLGPDAATDVVVTSGLYRGSVLIGDECSATLAQLPAGEFRDVPCSGVADAIAPYERTISASVSSSTSDPVSQNDHAGVLLRILTHPDLIPNLLPSLVDPGLPFTINLSILNRAFTPGSRVDVHVTIPCAEGFVDLPEGCASLSQTVVMCRIPSIPAAQSSFQWGEAKLPVTAIAPDDLSGSTLQVEVTVGGDHPDADPFNNEIEQQLRLFRTFLVTHGDDSGEGSLRSAIETASSSCGPDDFCKIAFRLDLEAGSAWGTIRPVSPLPSVQGSRIYIDGTTQTRLFGDSNPDGPEVEIRGDQIEGPANGLVLDTTCVAEVEGLVINGFEGSAILGGGSNECPNVHRRISDNYLGTDPTGMEARPNRRGIVIELGDFSGDPPIITGAPQHRYMITGNLVSGNLRSGIATLLGTWQIRENTIGLNRDRSAGLGNGASGIYIGPYSRGTDIIDNHVAFNHDFGIAIEEDAANIAIHGNSIHANWQGGIDIGLDGVTQRTGLCNAGVCSEDLALPMITTAFWDPAREVTVIEGVIEDLPQTIGQNGVFLFANDAVDASGYGEGQYYLGFAAVPNEGTFQFETTADLRGKWISGVSLLRNYVGFAKPVTGAGDDQGFLSVTSEFGQSVLVSP